MKTNKTLSMFPTIEESKAFFDEKKVVSNIIRENKAPIDLLIWASKYSIKK